MGDFSTAKIVASLLFGAIGFSAFLYGKKTGLWRPMALGAVLMGYPYFISNTPALYFIGIALTAALYFWRE